MFKIVFMRSLFPIVFLLLSACYFEPDGDFFKEIPEKDFSSLAIDLNNANDTLYISTITNLQYSVSASEFVVADVRATVGDKVVLSGGYGLSGSFFINPNDFATGTYTLTLLLIVQSGTGSMADRLNAEIVQVWRQFTLVIDSEPPAQRIISKLDTTNGTMVVYWNSYKKWNFQSYTLIKECSKDNYYYDVCDYITIDDKSDTTWIDSNYVGGFVRYRIDVSAADKTTRGDFKSYSWFPKTSFEVIDKKIKFYWQPPRFYANTKAVQLFTPNVNSQIIDQNDTSYQIEPIIELGSVYSISIIYQSEKDAHSLSFSPLAFVGQDYFYPISQPFLYHPIAKLYYGYSAINGGVTSVLDDRLNFKAMVYNQGKGNKRRLSLNGQYFITQVFNDAVQTFHDTDPTTLELSQGYSGIEGTAFDFSVANNGLVACTTSKGNVVFEWASKAQVFSNQVLGTRILISPSGQYLLNDQNIYRYQSGSFQLIGSVSIDFLSLVTFTKDNELAVSYSTGEIKFWNVESLTITKTIQTPIVNTWGLSYDTFSDRLMINDSHAHYMINPGTGSVTKIVSDSYPVTLVNSKLFAPLGGYLETFVGIDFNFFE